MEYKSKSSKGEKLEADRIRAPELFSPRAPRTLPACRRLPRDLTARRHESRRQRIYRGAQ